MAVRARPQVFLLKITRQRAAPTHDVVKAKVSKLPNLLTVKPSQGGCGSWRLSCGKLMALPGAGRVGA